LKDFRVRLKTILSKEKNTFDIYMNWLKEIGEGGQKLRNWGWTVIYRLTGGRGERRGRGKKIQDTVCM
jgi:hypothetical protein